MKARIILLLALGTMIVSSCSIENLEEPLIEANDPSMNELKSGSAEKQMKAFKFLERGDFMMVEPVSCNDLKQMELFGEGKSNRLGMFKTTIMRCTDLRDTNYFKGMHMTMTGDQLFFYSDGSGSDSRGKWFLYEYYGGTGQFKGAMGKVKVYVSEGFDSESSGQYKARGEGMLAF